MQTLISLREVLETTLIYISQYIKCTYGHFEEMQKMTDLFRGKKGFSQKTLILLFSSKLNILNFTLSRKKDFKKLSLSKKNLLNEFYDQYSFDHSIIKYHNGKKKDLKLNFQITLQKLILKLVWR